LKYRSLGNIDVSLICLGSMTWGEQNSEQDAFAQMDMAADYGVNFIDTAEMYAIPPRPETYGLSEKIIGNWLLSRGNREKTVLATKVVGRGDHNSGVGHIRGGPRLSRQHIVEAAESSLKRLKTDYIDLYQVHWPERQTNFFGELGYKHGGDDGYSIEETLAALEQLVEQGKVRQVGISNETPWGIHQYLRVAEQKGWPKIVSIQNPYNLLNRTFEVASAEFAMREGVQLLAYSPLAFGVLTGKYLGGKKPEGARLTLFERFTRYGQVNTEAAVQAYVDLANEQGISPAQLAIAFVNGREFVAANIIGATSLEQLKTNLEAAEKKKNSGAY